MTDSEKADSISLIYDVPYGGNMGTHFLKRRSDQQTVADLLPSLVEEVNAHLKPSVRDSKVDLSRVDVVALIDELVILIETKLSPANEYPGVEAGGRLRKYLEDDDNGRNDPSKEWLTREEAAQYLAMSRTTLNKMLSEGRLHARTREVGNRKQLLTEDVIRYKRDILGQLDPVKSEMVKEAQGLGLYDGEPKGR